MNRRTICTLVFFLALCSQASGQSGLITTFAGNRTVLASGDGGPATSAGMSTFGVAVDASGNVFIADSYNNLVRKVSADGIVTTVAGNGTQGFSGDGGPATSAALNFPVAVAVDASGNLFIADLSNNRVRKISASGTISTVAGNGAAQGGRGGSTGDGGPATSASLNFPSGVAVDASGNLFIADLYNYRVRKVSAGGTITTVAGNGAAGYSGDGGPAASAKLTEPYGLALDASGNLFIADYGNTRVRKVSASGTITTVAGNGNVGFSGDGGPAASAELNYPKGIAVDASGDLFIADSGNNVIREVSAGGVIRTVAGNGNFGFSGDGGPAVSAELQFPVGVAVDASGDVFIADYNSVIREVPASGAAAPPVQSPTASATVSNGRLPRRTATARPGATAYPEMALLPAGSFEMGDHYDFVDPVHPSDETPIHKVTLDSIYIGIYDVTNSQYVEFLNSAYAQGLITVQNGLVYGTGSTDFYLQTNQVSKIDSIGWDGTTFSVVDNRAYHPAEVRWFGAAAYANWLSRQQGLDPAYDLATWACDFTKNGYRLPTEAEWEYAARGGQYDPYYIYPWGNDADITKANWPESNSPYASGPQPWTTPVGFYDGQLHTKAEFGWPGSHETYQTGSGANPWGLYDMSGNNWQWINDWYSGGYYSTSPATNPTGPAESQASLMPDGQPYRGMRGGCWFNSDPGDPGHGSSANRDPSYYRAPDNPSTPYFHISFRVVRYAAGGGS
jgi:formylglycine-generating enzyme required for sulfatase activity/sugar lactone lactonase YvrE